MANFATPFANSGPRRVPTSDEKANGFPCGAADQALFNGLFHRIESEIGNVLSLAGVTQSDAQYNQLGQAIQSLIDAATGGGETEGYLLLSQAVARLPLFPEFLTVDGKVTVSSPANGTVRLPGGVSFLHRGINSLVTAQTDFNTVSNKTYHLRWNPVDGFTLKDVGNGTYNPSSLSESDAAFDTTYDDMLVARIVTNSSNVPTITNLVNKDRLKLSVVKSGASGALDGVYSSTFTGSETFNWSRTPVVAFSGHVATGGVGANGAMEYGNVISGRSVTRYAASGYVTSNWREDAGAPGGLTGALEIVATA